MENLERRVALLHRLAWICAALVLAITSLSAFVRLAKAGVGCEPWPQCYVQQRGQMAAGLPGPPDSAAITGARLVHRVVASGALLLIIAMVMISMARQPPLREAGRLVLGLMGVAIFLALIGRLAGDTPGPGIIMGNLLGGMGMVALAWRLVLATHPQGATGLGPPRAWVVAALALLALQLALGGVVSAGQAAAQCDASLPCNAHRIAAVLAVLVLAALAVVAWRTRPSVAVALVLLVLMQAGLGVAMLGLGLPLPLALAHNMVTALLIVTLVTLAR